MQRKIMPKAAVVLPLPLPVCTTIRPFSPVLVAMILSRAAFFLAILAAWRALASGVGVAVMAVSP
jgi:predicted transporter